LGDCGFAFSAGLRRGRRTLPRSRIVRSDVRHRSVDAQLIKSYQKTTFFCKIFKLFRDGRDAPRTRTRTDAFVLRGKASHLLEVDSPEWKKFA
jgi:hypothetical protein